MNDIKLGFDLAKLLRSYAADEIIKFLKGEKENCLYYDHLKPLYDAYGYEKVNNAILSLSEEATKYE